jgi:hypothetical protein
MRQPGESSPPNYVARDPPEGMLVRLRERVLHSRLVVALAVTRRTWRENRKQVLGKPNQTFEFAGARYPYFYHPFNLTWANERCVEIPLARAVLEGFRSRRVLEVGNVLGHYFPHGVARVVVDKYERRPGVVNVDILDYRAESPFDLVVSVSTLEHIGWDEPVRDAGKIPAAVQKLKSLVARGGTLFLTASLGYNPFLDRFLQREGPTLGEVRYLRRLSWDNRWAEVPADEVKGVAYGHWTLAHGRAPFLPKDVEIYPWSNAIAVARWLRP